MRNLSPGDVVAIALPHLSDGQNLTPFKALAQFFDTVELRTALTPPVKLNLATLGEPGGEPSPLGPLLRPTVVLTGPAGTQVIAPHGAAGTNGGMVLAAGAVGVATALLLTGYLLGRALSEP